MDLLQLRTLSYRFGDFRVVLHRATPERINSQVNSKVLLRETRIVANHFRLRNFRQGRQPISQQSLWNVLPRVRPDKLTLDVARFCWVVSFLTPSRSLDDEWFVPLCLVKHAL